ncbi:MAG: DUF2188 domain-containing protein [Flavisolibacter sp.]|nr:DUF2188 domain-containing protein [Flavisolibacter sp.]
MSDINKISKRIIKSIAQAATNGGNRLHVVPREDKWAVRKDGGKRARVIYPNREAAIDFARKEVEQGRFSYAVVHDWTGRIAQRIFK